MSLQEIFAVDKYVRELRGKSEKELKALSDHAFNVVMALPANASATQLYEAEQLNLKVKACNRLLKVFQNEKENRLKFFKDVKRWQETASRVNAAKKAIQALPTLASYNGQLVMTILECEPDRTLAELEETFNKVSSIERVDLLRLLANLKKENAITEADGHYRIVSSCDENMYATDFISWAKHVAENKGRKLYDDYLLLIRTLMAIQVPILVCEVDGYIYFHPKLTNNIPKEMEEHFDKVHDHMHAIEISNDYWGSDLNLVIFDMIELGILTKCEECTIENAYLCYFSTFEASSVVRETVEEEPEQEETEEEEFEEEETEKEGGSLLDAYLWQNSTSGASVEEENEEEETNEEEFEE